ncbi:MAG: hypothetical protein ACREF4_01550 [Gammaproteobacteria bacterium]
MAAARRAQQLEDEGGADSMGGGDHLRAGELRAADNGVEVEPREQRQEQEQAAGPGGERPGGHGERPHIGDGVGQGPRAAWALLIGPAGQPSKAFRPQDFLDGRGTEPGRAGPLELIADVVHGEVALAQDDDAGAHRVLARLGFRAVRGLPEEVAVHLVAKAPAEDPEGAGLVAEPEGHGGGRRAVGEVGAQRLVLALAGMRRLHEEPRRVCYRI